MDADRSLLFGVLAGSERPMSRSPWPPAKARRPARSAPPFGLLTKSMSDTLIDQRKAGGE